MLCFHTYSTPSRFDVGTFGGKVGRSTISESGPTMYLPSGPRMQLPFQIGAFQTNSPARAPVRMSITVNGGLGTGSLSGSGPSPVPIRFSYQPSSAYQSGTSMTKGPFSDASSGCPSETNPNFDDNSGIGATGGSGRASHLRIGLTASLSLPAGTNCSGCLSFGAISIGIEADTTPSNGA